MAQGLNRDNHVRPSSSDSEAILVASAYFSHVFSLLDANVVEGVFVHAMVHGIKTKSDKTNGDAADDDDKNVKRESTGGGVAFHKC